MAKADEMRKKGMERLPESQKKNQKRRRISGSETLSYIKEKAGREMEFREEELEVKRAELKQQKKQQKTETQQRLLLQQQDRQPQQMQQMNALFLQQQQQQNALLMGLMDKLCKQNN